MRSEPRVHFTTSMEACMCFPLLPETKRVANEIVERQREREKEGVVINTGKTIPLALLSSDRWHRELIPRLSCMLPSTAPSRVSPGPPWQIWRAMWPCCIYLLCRWPRWPLAGYQKSYSVNFLHTLAPKNWRLFVLSNPPTNRIRVSKLYITCVFRHTLRLLAYFRRAEPPRMWFLS